MVCKIIFVFVKKHHLLYSVCNVCFEKIIKPKITCKMRRELSFYGCLYADCNVDNMAVTYSLTYIVSVVIDCSQFSLVWLNRISSLLSITITVSIVSI